MTIRLLQLNIQKGARLDAVIRYIRNGNFDIVCLQEVAGGKLAVGGRNSYEELIAGTGMAGELSVSVRLRNDQNSFLGVATLFRRPWQIVSQTVVWLKRYQELPRAERIDARTVSRCALATTIARGTSRLMVVNTHLAWGPTPNDTLYKKNQAEKLYRWIKTHAHDPFILAGDFNLNPQTAIVTKLSSLGVNLTKKFRVTNTLNPKLHYAKNLFPSGLPVDYVITDRRLTVKKFFVEAHANLSDHYGLVAEVEA